MPAEFPAHGLAPLEAELEIAASVDVVWSLLSDLRAMSDRSPETVRMVVSTAPDIGTRALNLNRKGAVVWPTTARITQWKPPANDGAAALAFHVWPTGVEWSYELTPVPAGTLVRERRTGLTSPNRLVRFASRWLMGGAEHHDVELRDGMRRTLESLRAEAEARG